MSATMWRLARLDIRSTREAVGVGYTVILFMVAMLAWRLGLGRAVWEAWRRR